jgi:hypothetical protein
LNRRAADRVEGQGAVVEDSDLFRHLRGLEAELHRLETRRNRERLEQLLHPDFVEFARSGRCYTRDEVLAEFSAAGATLESVRVEQFDVAEIHSGAALVTYASVHESATGESHRRTLRSSLWVETATGWRMRFHQGTPADEAPSA